jgi:hypothetical protein
MTTMFDLCRRCGHARLDHEGGECETCRLDLEVHETFLGLPGTAALEAELPAPRLCPAFLEAKEVADRPVTMGGPQ